MRISLSQSNRWIAVTSKYSRRTSPARASYSARIFATYFFPYKRKTKASRLQAAPPQESSPPRNPPWRLHIPVPPTGCFPGVCQGSRCRFRVCLSALHPPLHGIMRYSPTRSAGASSQETTCASKKFMDGVPMNPATNRLTGFA